MFLASKGRANEFVAWLISGHQLGASGDGSETFGLGVLDTRHLTIMRGEAPLGSQNASKHEVEQG